MKRLDGQIPAIDERNPVIRSLAHACFVVSDLDRAVRFYSGALGLPVAFEFKNDKGQRNGLYLSCGQRTFIELFAGRVEQTQAKSSYRHISIETDDIDGLIARLAEHSIQAGDKKLGADGSWQAWISDPDGNRIELHQYTADSLQERAIGQGG